jgi:predicted nucleotidyltransferase/predicted transcriptional regulator
MVLAAGKRPTGSAVREPLSYALGTRAKVACLRVLSLVDGPLTQREVARRAHLQHRSAQLALDELVALGVVSRVEGGRDFLVRLNSRHRLAASLAGAFHAEAAHFLELRRRLVELAAPSRRGSGITSLVLFGSAARGDDDPESDLDLLLVAADPEPALERVQAGVEEVVRVFGVRVKPIAYTTADARRLYRRRLPPLREIARDGVLLFGSPMRDLVNGPA